MADDAPPRLMQIGEVAERAGMSLRTLRHYDEVGLLVPSARSEGGFRLYTQDDLDRLMVIRRMKPLGYGLEEMHTVMDLLHADAAATTEWADLVTEARNRRADLARHLEMADEFVSLLEQRGRWVESPATGPRHSDEMPARKANETS